MERTLHAVYENGHLRLLDPVTLREGEQVYIKILSEREKVLAAVAHLLVPNLEITESALDDDALQAEIDVLIPAGVNVSDAIIEERSTGP